MTRTALIIAPILLVALLLSGSFPVQAEDLPQIEIPNPEHHAGTVLRGESCTAVFTVRNSGTADLRLIEADGHCSCIETTIPSTLIPPGGEGTVEVRFVGQTAIGETTRTIELTSNDQENRVSRLTFRALVAVPFGFETRALALGKIHYQTREPVTRQAVLLVQNAELTDLAGLESSSPHITAHLVGTDEPRDGHQRLEIEVSVLPDLPPGVIRESITARPMSEQLEPATLTVTGIITNDVEVSPERLRLMVVETGKRLAKDSWARIYFTGHCPDRRLNVYDCQDSNGVLDLDIVELIAGEKFELTATLKADALKSGSDITGHISVSTNSPSQPLIIVEYSAARRQYHKLDQSEEEAAPPVTTDQEGPIDG